MCQYKEGDKIFENAFFEFTKSPEEEQSAYGRTHYAYALEIYGKSAKRPKILKEAKDLTCALIQEANNGQYTERHIGELYKLLGDCEEAIEGHQAAVVAYTKSLEVYPNDLTKVFLARSLCNNEEIELGRNLLNKTEVTNLDKEGKFDLAISWALLAAKSILAEDLMIAKSILEEVETKDPLFIQLRDSWMIDLLKMKPKAESGKIKDLIHKLNNWVTLKPNFFGFGVDINKIIDDAISEKPTKPKDEN